jgi:hypothetical protein
MNEEKGEAVAAEIGGVFCKVDVTDDERSPPPSPRPAPPMARSA